jgi:hypothetical protein
MRSVRCLIMLIAGLALVAPAVAFPCVSDSDCPGQWCDESTGMCTAKLANGSPIPNDPAHTNPTLNGTCTAGAGTLVCASGVCDTGDNACGFADGDGPCTMQNAGTVCRSGVCSVDGLCEPAGGCNADADCTGGNWCDESTHTCTPKLANGSPIPNDPAHTNPTLNGTCTAGAGTLVCASGVCDVADNACGFADGDGPCTPANGAVVCRSGVCNANGTCGTLPTTTSTSSTTTTSTTLSDDTGMIPPDPATLKCEAAVAKAAAKLWAGFAACHKGTAAAALQHRPFDEEACEVAAKAKFDKGTASLKGCPPCLGGAGLAAIRGFVDTTADGSNGMFYCAGTTPFP